MDNCTDITILKPINYGPMTVIEDPDYDHRVHSRMSFNANDYYLRRLSTAETLVQVRPRMMYEVMKDVQLSCVYDGRTELVTCPAGCVLDGDSLKKMFNIENDGIAWVFHDWLYYSHAFDVRADGTQTKIPRHRRWVPDELMYNVIKMDGYTTYSWFTQRFDSLASSVLNDSWDYSPKNVDKTNLYIALDYIA